MGKLSTLTRVGQLFATWGSLKSDFSELRERGIGRGDLSQLLLQVPTPLVTALGLCKEKGLP